jgi:DNA (cytosine-5)-methyltransferase 1
LNELCLFAGGGGGLLATQHLLGFRTICYVEIDNYCQEILKARIRDGLLDDAPIWDDVRTFDGKPWRGCVDIVTGGDPCQANSNASLSASKHQSLADVFLRIVAEVRPYFVLRENPYQVRADAPWPADRFAAGLEYLGYASPPLAVRACCMGADHKRERLFLPSATSDADSQPNIQTAPTAVAERVPFPQATELSDIVFGRTKPAPAWQLFASDVCRKIDGVAHRVDRLKALGNGQVPIVVAKAWELLSQ